MTLCRSTRTAAFVPVATSVHKRHAIWMIACLLSVWGLFACLLLLTAMHAAHIFLSNEKHAAADLIGLPCIVKADNVTKRVIIYPI